MACRRALLLVLLVTVTGCARPPAPALSPLPQARAGAPVSFADVRPILEQRCVVCHACNDAPCQLLLSSPEGIARGASKEPVYRSDRLLAAPTTRLGIDAQTTEEWRARGFFSVTGDGGSSESLLRLMLELGRAHPVAAGDKLPPTVPLDIDRALTCAETREFSSYARSQPFGGMPYAMAPLSDAELATLSDWISAGAPLPEATPALPPSAAAQIAQWESFLNGDDLKQQVTSRYLYEHWFLAHLYFDDQPAGPFYRLVRSSTPPGQPVREIATRRPYDAPGVDRVWYRFVPIDATTVHKTHIVYPLGPARMARLRSLFIDADWQATRMPSYAPEHASNPFETFAEIPPRSRYQYLLDDAQYFVMTFIRGPVCRGQVAVDVIEDHFFVAFLDPDRDLSVIDPGFLPRATPLLRLPAEHGSHLAPGEFWIQYGVEQRRYLDMRAKAYDALDPQRRGPALEWIWDGDGHNPNAQLTVFRNFDNATVVKGFLGAHPKTAWIMDYPLFERIYYDLVAGFDVYGNVTHQVATRLYMDHLRMQSENLFLTFLPADRRAALRASWYVGATASLDYARVDRLHGLKHGTQIAFSEPDVSAQLADFIAARNPVVSGPPDLLNRCAAPPCDRPDATPLERRAERALQPLAGVRGAWVAQLPEVSLLRVRGADGDDAVYTLLHNRAHTNVAFMFDEAERLVPADDTITVARGYLGSYPNFIFQVDGDQIEAFPQTLSNVHDSIDFEAVVDSWGVRRTDPNIWPTLDFVHADFRARQPTEFGLFDVDRYGNY